MKVSKINNSTLLTEWEEKLDENFPGLTIKKDIAETYNSKKLPRYVFECLLSKLIRQNDSIDISELVHIIDSKLDQYVVMNPSDASMMRYELQQTGKLNLFTRFRMLVPSDISKSNMIEIPKASISKCHVIPDIVNDIEKRRLLIEGCWGYGTIIYEEGAKVPILTNFEAVKLDTKASIDNIINGREEFKLEEWVNCLISSCGLKPDSYTSFKHKLLFLSRLIGTVESGVTLLEFGAPGTGKSTTIKNISNYSIVLDSQGGEITYASLFFNKGRKIDGYILTKDLVVFDDLHRMETTKAKQIISGLLRFTEFNTVIKLGNEEPTNSSIMFFANDTHGDTIEEFINSKIPSVMNSPEFLSRISGIIPGRELPTVKNTQISDHLGFTGDFFSEYLHFLKNKSEHYNHLRTSVNIINTIGNQEVTMRDAKNIFKIAAGYAKLLFPDIKMLTYQGVEICMNMAIQHRQIIRDLSIITSDPHWGKAKFDFVFNDGHTKSTNNPEDFGKDDNELNELIIQSDQNLFDGDVIDITPTGQYEDYETYKKLPQEVKLLEMLNKNEDEN